MTYSGKRTSSALLLAAGLSVFAAAQSRADVVYTYTGADFTLCSNMGGGGACGGLTNNSGSFTVATALAANLSVDTISGELVSYSFTNGLTTFSNTTPGITIDAFYVSTDSSGHIIEPSGVVLSEPGGIGNLDLGI